ncbi:amidophosphoribosyltransferase [Candidatus Micrarchaeota archaeon]|nr:amidophosphoribosyltransferase [Candidatus Micrarchaeota archaeon]
MCGIIGIMGKADVAFDVYRGLLALQHRGQDSAGIACFDKVRINLKKGVGLVSEVFTDSNLSLLKGKTAIGHVRYATAGSTPKLDSQPFVVDIPHAMAIAHNGNAINYQDWDEHFKDRTESCCDSEVLLHLFSEKLNGDRQLTVDKIFDAVKAFMAEVNGSYGIVCLVENLGLLAFRDPHANRPLAMGRRGADVAFASESVAFDAMGFDMVRDLKGGEAIFVESDGTIHEKSLLPKPAKHCMFEWVYFARPDSTLDGKSVYEVRIALGKELGKAIQKDSAGKMQGQNGLSMPDVVIPVPDTSRPAALGLAEQTGISLQEGLIKNRYIGRTFIMPTQEGRERAMNVKLNTVTSVVKGKDVLLVDDSIVRGTTAKKIVGVVKKEAKSVHLASTCPPIQYPCFYGIDFPIQSELVAYTEKNLDGIRKKLGADGLTYQSLDGLKRAIGLPGLCTACLDGHYPTPIPDAMRKKLELSRSAERKKVETHYA